MATAPPLPIVQGTLDLLILSVLAPGPLHGYGVATAVHQRTEGDLAIPDAALYQALHRLERQDLVDAEWAPSDNNRKAKYYELTKLGRRQLAAESDEWARLTTAVGFVLDMK